MEVERHLFKNAQEMLVLSHDLQQPVHQQYTLHAQVSLQIFGGGDSDDNDDCGGGDGDDSGDDVDGGGDK